MTFVLSPASFHGSSTALVAPVVSSVVQVADFGVDLHYRVWDPSGETMSQSKLRDAVGL